MQANAKEQRNRWNANALRRIREHQGMSRLDLADKLGVSFKTIEKYENGRAILDEGKIKLILDALSSSWEEFLKIRRRGDRFSTSLKEKKVLLNSDRRSYRKEITKEVRVLRCLRHMRNIPQDQASALCGYSRPTIGHIENGRIEIPLSRIQHIVTSYGFEMNYFEDLMRQEILRDEAFEFCINKLRSFSDEKIKLVQSIISNF